MTWSRYSQHNSNNYCQDQLTGSRCKGCCQTLGLVLRLRVDFVLPLSQEQEEEEQEQEQEEQEPPTKIYQMGVY